MLKNSQEICTTKRINMRYVLSILILTSAAFCNFATYGQTAHTTEQQRSFQQSAKATYRTKNFIVYASSEQFAKECAETAEKYRKLLAVKWLKTVLPAWSAPCPITVNDGSLGAGGATKMLFDRGEVFGWRMTIQGSKRRILDSVIPHEVNHTILASYYRRPLPRWADEGAATLVEHEEERRRQQLMLKQAFDNKQLFEINVLLSIKEYPKDMRRVLVMYAQGHSITSYLVQVGGEQKFIRLLTAAKQGNWGGALKTLYGFNGTHELEMKWKAWVLSGSNQIIDNMLKEENWR